MACFHKMCYTETVGPADILLYGRAWHDQTEYMGDTDYGRDNERLWKRTGSIFPQNSGRRCDQGYGDRSEWGRGHAGSQVLYAGYHQSSGYEQWSGIFCDGGCARGWCDRGFCGENGWRTGEHPALKKRSERGTCMGCTDRLSGGEERDRCQGKWGCECGSGCLSGRYPRIYSGFSSVAVLCGESWRI